MTGTLETPSVFGPVSSLGIIVKNILDNFKPTSKNDDFGKSVSERIQSLNRIGSV